MSSPSTDLVGVVHYFSFAAAFQLIVGGIMDLSEPSAIIPLRTNISSAFGVCSDYRRDREDRSEFIVDQRAELVGHEPPA